MEFSPDQLLSRKIEDVVKECLQSNDPLKSSMLAWLDRILPNLPKTSSTNVLSNYCRLPERVLNCLSEHEKGSSAYE